MNQVPQLKNIKDTVGFRVTWPKAQILLLLLFSHSVVSNSLQPHGLQPPRLLCPQDFPGKNTGVCSHYLLQGDLPNPGIAPVTPSLGFFTTESPGKSTDIFTKSQFPSMRASLTTRAPFKGMISHNYFMLHFLTFKSSEKLYFPELAKIAFALQIQNNQNDSSLLLCSIQ